MTATNEELCSKATEVKKIIEPLDLMKVKFIDSPNKSDRKKDIKFIVLHHTGPGNLDNVVKWLCDPVSQASAHYVVGYGGEIVQLVNTKRKSWHAGVSEWGEFKDINHYSIGIEICNIGILHKDEDGDFTYAVGRGTTKYRGKVEPVESSITYPNGNIVKAWGVPYPEIQINSVVALCKGLIKKYPQITKENIITHFQIALPLGIKNDPFGLDAEYVIDKIFQE